MKTPIYVIDTSDSRMFYVMRALQEAGYNACSRSAHQDTSSAYYVYSPAKRFTREELLNLPNGSCLIAGNLPRESIQLLENKSIRHYNLLLDEIFAIENAIQTAEAALMLMIRATNTSIFRSRIMIYGYGRLGKSLARLFKGVGLDFAVCTNDYYERAEAHINCQDVYDLNAPLQHADIIVNTIPARIFNLEKLQSAKKSCYILDLASFSGVESADINSLELNYDNALGLPGKYSPKSAGEIMATAIMNLKEEGLC